MDRKPGSEWDRDVPTLVTSPDHPTTDRDGERPRSLSREIPALVLLAGSGAGQRFILDQVELVIGRGSDAQICLDSSNVSRHHARLKQQPSGEFLIEDLRSRNGTLVNDVRIQTKILRVGDRIQLGPGTVLLFTHHNSVEEKFLEAQKLESIGRLAGGIAHDFNNIMASLLADIRFLQTLRTEDLEAQEASDCLRTMEQAAQRAVNLTNQLLGFARGGKYSSQRFDVASLLEDLNSFFERSLGAAIEVELDLARPVFVVGDRNQLHQVLLNLCLNARDAMPDGGTLTLRSAIAELSSQQTEALAPLRPGQHVVITVSDTGVGMSDKTLKRAFEPYFTTKTVGQGSGLGLAAAYGIVKNHGGHISAASEPGRGSTFTIYLAAASQETGQRTTTAQVASLSGLVLLADDDEIVRQATAQMLERMGYTPLPAENGHQALELFTARREEIRFVILDMFMPKVSGKETCKAIRAIDPRVKVMLTSGYLDEERVGDLLKGGGVIFLQKPYRPAVFRKTVVKLLEGSDDPAGPGDPEGPKDAGEPDRPAGSSQGRPIGAFKPRPP